jgi:hypothetical protein
MERGGDRNRGKVGEETLRDDSDDGPSDPGSGEGVEKGMRVAEVGVEGSGVEDGAVGFLEKDDVVAGDEGVGEVKFAGTAEGLVEEEGPEEGLGIEGDYGEGRRQKPRQSGRGDA